MAYEGKETDAYFENGTPKNGISLAPNQLLRVLSAFISSILTKAPISVHSPISIGCCNLWSNTPADIEFAWFLKGWHNQWALNGSLVIKHQLPQISWVNPALYGVAPLYLFGLALCPLFAQKKLNPLFEPVLSFIQAFTKKSKLYTRKCRKND